LHKYFVGFCIRSALRPSTALDYGDHDVVLFKITVFFNNNLPAPFFSTVSLESDFRLIIGKI